MIHLLHGDCLSEMAEIKNKSVDLIICDLPYGVTQNKDDIRIPFMPLWAHYERIIKDNGAILLFGQGLFFIDLVSSNRKMYRYDLIWDKVLSTGFLNAKRCPLRKHEQIAVFYKKQPIYNPQFSQGKPLHGKGVAYKDKQIKNQNYGQFHATDDIRKGSTEKYPTSIISISKPHPSAAKHRTEKPIELIKYLIQTYSNEGEMVMDNCMGAGGVGVACVETKRNFIGIELDRDYFDVAQKRILV